MAIVPIPPIVWPSAGFALTVTGATLNAATEQCAAVGHLYLVGQTGSKTISAAGGGKIYWCSASSITWANAGTNFRIGIQDVTAATGLNDGTFDVYADLVPGTETVANNTIYGTAMESGTKTMSHGDMIAIAFEMTARGGVDQVSVDRYGHANLPFGFPYGTQDIGTHQKTNNSIPSAVIQFDDGTYGWIAGAQLLTNTSLGESVLTFNSGTTPDEYAAVFQLPVKMVLSAISVSLANVASTDTYEILLYSDPFGTPVVERTFAPDPDQAVYSQITPLFQSPSLTPVFTCEASTYYAIAVRATSVNNISWGYYDAGSGNEVLKVGQIFSAIKNAARTNQTGPFVETQTYHTPNIGISICGIEDGGGGPGGGAFATAAFG